MRAVAVVCSLMLCSLWLGCSTHERYKVLNFFFDGVPNPDALASGPGSRGKGGAGIVVTHKPYADAVASGNCSVCHSSDVSNMLYTAVTASVSPTICLKCHQDIPHQYPVMHGPVASVECLFCHAAHEANQPALLWKKSPDVCMQCHTRELLDPAQPAHLAADSDCLSCHFAHGAAQHGLLKPNRIAWSATTAPATTVPKGGAQ